MVTTTTSFENSLKEHLSTVEEAGTSTRGSGQADEASAWSSFVLIGNVSSEDSSLLLNLVSLLTIHVFKIKTRAIVNHPSSTNTIGNID